MNEFNEEVSPNDHSVFMSGMRFEHNEILLAFSTVSKSDVITNADSQSKVKSRKRRVSGISAAAETRQQRRLRETLRRGHAR